jgi:hypothetical protein
MTKVGQSITAMVTTGSSSGVGAMFTGSVSPAMDHAVRAAAAAELDELARARRRHVLGQGT